MTKTIHAVGVLIENLNFNLQSTEAVKFKWAKPDELYKEKDLMSGLYIILKDLYKL